MYNINELTKHGVVVIVKFLIIVEPNADFLS